MKSRKWLLLWTSGLVVCMGIIFYFRFLPFPFLEKPPTLRQMIEKEGQITHFEIHSAFVPEPISFEKIFADDHGWTATLAAERVTTVVATGDVIPARSVNFKTTQLDNFLWPWEKTAAVLKQADVTLINLESPLVKSCPLTNTGMIFCGEPRHLQGLAWAGVDVVNLANNHLENYGELGVKETWSLLEEANILAAGVDKPVFREVKGKTWAFLGYDDIERGVLLAATDEKRIKKEVGEARKEAEMVIVSFHWGVEYTTQPILRQQDLAHLAIDSGADLVIGNHPHWTQPVEIYKNKLIMYAHGNFIFDQMWSAKTEEGVVGRYTFYDDQLIDAEFLPIEIADYGQPYFLMGAEKGRVLMELKEISQVLAGERRE